MAFWPSIVLLSSLKIIFKICFAFSHLTNFYLKTYWNLLDLFFLFICYFEIDLNFRCVRSKLITNWNVFGVFFFFCWIVWSTSNCHNFDFTSFGNSLVNFASMWIFQNWIPNIKSHRRTRWYSQPLFIYYYFLGELIKIKKKHSKRFEVKLVTISDFRLAQSWLDIYQDSQKTLFRVADVCQSIHRRMKFTHFFWSF